jgi:broad-specificity NMP kinase
MNQHKIYFISGVSGVGKSLTMTHLKNILSSEKYDIRDLDERGVPDGGGQEWLNNETRHWLDVATSNAENGKSTIICGFANPELFKIVYKPKEDIPAELILLHASGHVIEERLRRRHSTPESIKEIERASGISLDKFIENCKSFAPTLHSIFERIGGTIIETDSKSPEIIVREIIKFLERSNQEPRHS